MRLDNERASGSFLLGARLVTAFAAVAVYANSLGNGFALDDLIHIVNNPSLRTLDGVLRALASPLYPGNLYRPVVSLLHGLLYVASGGHAFPFHLVNVSLHALAAVFVFEILKLFITPRLSLVSALIFAVHPIHSEAVSNVTGGAEVISNFFLLVSLYLILTPGARERGSLRPKRFWRAVAIGTTAFLAFASKESTLMLLLLAPFSLHFLREKPDDKSIFYRCEGTVLAALLYLSLRWYVLSGLGLGAEVDFLDNPLAHVGIVERVLSATVFLGKYISLVVAPISLSADYSFRELVPVSSLGDLSACAFFYLTALLMAFFLRGLSAKNAEGYFAGFFFITFLMTSNVFFPIGTIFGERLVYLPSIGVISLVVIAVSHFKSIAIRMMLLCGVVISFSAATVYHNEVWKDNEHLHSYQIDASPLSAKTHLNYAVVLRDEHRLSEAAFHAREALSIYPAYDHAAYVLGTIAQLRGSLDEAEKWYNEALRINPYSVPVLSELGRVKLNRNQVMEAISLFESARALEPGNVEVLNGLFAAALKEGDRETALTVRELIKKIDPSNEEAARLDPQLNAPEVGQ